MIAKICFTLICYVQCDWSKGLLLIWSYDILSCKKYSCEAKGQDSELQTLGRTRCCHVLQFYCLNVLYSTFSSLCCSDPSLVRFILCVISQK